jgi:hypothetical protein
MAKVVMRTTGRKNAAVATSVTNGRATLTYWDRAHCASGRTLAIMGLRNRSAMMNELETHSRPPVGELRGAPAGKTNVDTQLGKCLIASTDGAKREMICLAATEAGWDTIVCADEHKAMAAAQRTRFQMAWVDLDVSPAKSAFRDLCQTVAALPGVLLVICGHVNDSAEEIWARQLGVWLYLPGLSLDHANEISLLCEQAQRVAGRSKAST